MSTIIEVPLFDAENAPAMAADFLKSLGCNRNWLPMQISLYGELYVVEGEIVRGVRLLFEICIFHIVRLNKQYSLRVYQKLEYVQNNSELYTTLQMRPDTVRPISV